MQIVPVVEGTRQPHATLQLRVGAGNLNEYLARLITEHGVYYDAAVIAHIEALDTIKRELCYISLDPRGDADRSELSQERSCTLKDGTRVTIGSEAWRCPEGLFSPSLMGLDIDGVAKNVFQAIQKSPIDTRNELFSHIVLTGGSTLFPNFEERLRVEVRRLMNVASQRHLSILAVKQRKYLPWLGASVFASVDTFPATTMFNNEYHER